MQAFLEPLKELADYQETILRVKSYSIEHQTMNLDPTDMRGLQHLMEEKRKLENLKNLNITIQ